MAPGGLVKDPVSAISLGMALIFGTAGLPHILMRFYTVPDATPARSRCWWRPASSASSTSCSSSSASAPSPLVLGRPTFKDAAGNRSAATTWWRCTSRTGSAARSCWASSRPWPSPPSSPWSRASPSPAPRPPATTSMPGSCAAVRAERAEGGAGLQGRRRRPQPHRDGPRHAVREPEHRLRRRAGLRHRRQRQFPRPAALGDVAQA